VLQRLSNGAVQARINSNFYRLPDTAGKIIVYGGEGSDHITVSQSLLYDFELYGGPGNDYIAGGRYDDIIDGGEGNDRLLARSGNNIFYGGDGNDVIRGGVGDDIAFGGAGRDIIYGGDGNDVLVGGDGNDILRGERGDDILLGGDGNDVLWGGQGHDLLDGGAGNDVLYGNAGRDILIGGFGADSLFGGADDDALIGGFVDFGIDPDDEEDPDSFELYLEELYMLLQDWLIPGSLQDRIEFVSDRIGPDVVVEDNARDAMWGGSGQDWFVTDGRDLVRDKRAGDIINDGFDDDFFWF
jgi:Ca2+-binding RTX toxin-like protein